MAVIQPGEKVNTSTNNDSLHNDEAWQAELATALGGDIRESFVHAFPVSYRHQNAPETVLEDIALFSLLGDEQPIAIRFYRPEGVEDTNDVNTFNIRIAHRNTAIALSDILPVLENFGLRIISEHPYQITPSDTGCYWLHDFEVNTPKGIAHSESIAELFEMALKKVWKQKAESDWFNDLVLKVGINWQQVVMLRAYSKYMKQLVLPYTRPYIAETLGKHADVTRQICRLFDLRFNPSHGVDDQQRQTECQVLEEKITLALEEVDNLTDDQILREYLCLINATLRTNYYQQTGDGQPVRYLSFKFDVNQIPNAPLPRPLYEIFVYSPDFEGVHLRGGKVARGGLRWSDRIEDFRTEVLGLVKAQQVKNSVIVPMGAKGGFICKKAPAASDRQAFLNNGVSCYRQFISALLEITDNLVDGEVITPKNVVRWDDDDPYLVVAADKGTATFSDIANEISMSHNFWMGDAFASGGSVGYDHKGMGITARGAWVSVQRHFREMGIDVQNQEFNVVAVGDMGGDVFGNGMLCSDKICLQAAFNHLHIFIDPSPNAEASFAERERLFNADQSGWEQYNTELISKGGGVFLRTAKSILLTPEIRECFGIEANTLTPNELIKAILKAPVDLFWNGGIGTYVKAKTETDASVGDRANDALRVNGSEFGAKVVGEGGNLGLTQLGRVEYSLKGGRCNTDFIDNAAGVDCSDHEVNIKILFQQLLEQGIIDNTQRTEMLYSMTDNVSELVLHNNYRQAQAISLSEDDAEARDTEYQRLISHFEQQGTLNRELEFIPSEDALSERKSYGNYLVRPELSVLVSYAKLSFKLALAQSTLAEDHYVAKEAYTAFPAVLVESYAQQIDQHQLHREIVATQVANEIVNRMGISFVHRMQQATGESEDTIARAYIACRDLFNIEHYWKAIESLDHKVDSNVQYEMFDQIVRLVRRSTRWLLREHRSQINIGETVERYQSVAHYLLEEAEGLLQGEQLAALQYKTAKFVEAGVPAELAHFVAMARYSYTTFSIAEAGNNTASSIDKVAGCYTILGERLELNWFADQIMQMRVDSYWAALARESFRDELEYQHSALVQSVIFASSGDTMEATVDSWLNVQANYVARWEQMTAELRCVSELDLAMFPVALRELVDLSQSAEKNSMAEYCSLSLTA